MKKINQIRKPLKNKRIKQRKMSKKKRIIRRELLKIQADFKFTEEIWADELITIKKKNFFVRYVGETFEIGTKKDGWWWIKAIKGKIYPCREICKEYGEIDQYKVCDETGKYHTYQKAETPEGEEIHNVERYEYLIDTIKDHIEKKNAKKQQKKKNVEKIIDD